MDALAIPELALIDLDGTLVDTVPDLAWSVDETLARLGLPSCGEGAVRRWIGNGAASLVRRALTGEMDGEPEQALFERAYPLFLDVYADHCTERSRVYPGAREGLALLESMGVTLGCVTNKPARFTEPLLRSLGMYDCFGTVVSGDTVAKKKPDPLPLLHAAGQLGKSTARSLLIGDSVSDVKAARAAGFSIVCVSYGYNHGLNIRDAAPDAVIDSMSELDRVLSRAA